VYGLAFVHFDWIGAWRVFLFLAYSSSSFVLLVVGGGGSLGGIYRE
jgi:hypothetical protein